MRILLHVVLLVTLCLKPAAAMPAEGHRLMISAPSPYAVEVGRAIAMKGGNVVDVAVAVGLTLSVTTPYYAALGGGGFAMVKMAGDVEALDFREVAPTATGKDTFLVLDKDAPRTGGLAVGVPGLPAGLWALHQKFGRLGWAELFDAPIRLARDGFAVSGEWAVTTAAEHARFTKAGLQRFLKADGTTFKPGEVLAQPDLANALAALRDKGPAGFYGGPVAEDVVDAVRTAGGRMSLADLAAYKVRWLPPLKTAYEGHTLYLMPPPSSGGVLIISALKLIEKLNVKARPALSADEYHLLAEIEARVFRGRTLLGDPAFHDSPVAFLTSGGYLNELAQSIDEEKAVVLPPLRPDEIKEGTQTTHFSVMDSGGHAVAVTVTLNASYGSGVVTPGFGIALNDEMDDFTTRPEAPNMYGLIQGEANAVEPGKRPLSSMSPTLVEKDGDVVMSLGAPGGPRIITSVLQVLYRLIARGLDADMAVQAPRVHHQFRPDILFVDRGRFAPEIIQSLSARGHQIREGGMGKVYVVRRRADGILEGAYDSRGEGAAGGL